MSELHTPELLTLARELDAVCPASPHRLFVRRLVREVHGRTGRVYAESWYRRLMVASGIARRPSTRTVNACVRAVKDEVGEAKGPTQTAVAVLQRQFNELSATVRRLEALVERVAAVAERQAAISEGIDRRQLMFTDQSQVYQRQIDQLAAVVRDNVGAAREVTRNANDVALSAARAMRELQTALQRLPPATG